MMLKQGENLVLDCLWGGNRQDGYRASPSRGGLGRLVERRRRRKSDR